MKSHNYYVINAALTIYQYVAEFSKVLDPPKKINLTKRRWFDGVVEGILEKIIIDCTVRAYFLE